MISIIIPTFNEEDFLPHLLGSLKKQTYGDYEVIVSDNHSSDNTRSVALEAGAMVVDGGSPACGRNNGARIAHSDWLLFLDADVVLPPNFLEEAIAEIEKQGLSVASCFVLPLSDKKTDKLLHGVANQYLWVTKRFSPHAPGFCIFIKKKLHQSLNGFDEKIKLAEDHDYVSRAGKVAKFDFLQNVRIPVSVRRLDKDGRLRVSVKYIAVEAHRAILGPIYSEIFRYKFGYPAKSNIKSKEVTKVI
jgi:glycosyltransferase involved in cell wall biosynthesis